MEWLNRKNVAGYLLIALLCFGPATVIEENRGTPAPAIGGLVMSAFWPLWLSYEVSWAIFGEEKQYPDYRIKKVEK